ncbi:hypothetical protein AB0I60_06430 [Actinosynnema sp. NPDC050436]|uniref:effector-associated domain 2-containing protein n=1 Tax=Actinosynnema sp. NPDC050436 TaxID=3155659 RepID=UPI0033D2B601
MFTVDHPGGPGWTGGAVGRGPADRLRVRRAVEGAISRAFADAVIRWDSDRAREGVGGGRIFIPPHLPGVVLLNRAARCLAGVSGELRGPPRIRLGLCARPVDGCCARFAGAGADIMLAGRRLASAELRENCVDSTEMISATAPGMPLPVAPAVPADPTGQFSAPPQDRGRAVGDALTALVEALLEVAVIRDDGMRRMVLTLLPPPVGAAVPHHPSVRPHVFELVRTCRDYDDGMNALFRVLRDLEGDSIPLRRAEAAARQWLVREEGSDFGFRP